jgi:hypothetical protein
MSIAIASRLVCARTYAPGKRRPNRSNQALNGTFPRERPVVDAAGGGFDDDCSESLSQWSSAEHVPIEELARRQGVQPMESLDDLGSPDLWDSDEEYERFLADLYASHRSGLA